MIRRAALAALLVVVASLAACEKVNVVSSSVSPCFRVLPIAREAVDRQGTYVDVARIRESALPRIPLHRPSDLGRTLQSEVPAQPPSTTLVHPDVCVVAYKGTFDPSRIPLLVGTARTGKYAMVVIGVRSQEVRGVVLLDRLPRPLHAH